MHDHSTQDQHSHGHSHDHGPHWIFILGIILNFTFFIADMIVWQISGSTAIFGDSIHNGFHGLAHVVALWGHSLEGGSDQHQESHASKQRKIRAVQIIGVLIILGALLIAGLGIKQILNPGEVISKYMLIMASLDIVSNAVLFVLLISHRGDKTVSAVVLDIAIDTLASIGVIVGGIVIMLTQFYQADGIAAIPIALIALFLAYETIRNSKNTPSETAKNP